MSRKKIAINASLTQWTGRAAHAQLPERQVGALYSGVGEREGNCRGPDQHDSCCLLGPDKTSKGVRYRHFGMVARKARLGVKIDDKGRTSAGHRMAPEDPTLGSGRATSGRTYVPAFRARRSTAGNDGSTSSKRRAWVTDRGYPTDRRATSSAVVSKILYLRQHYHFGPGRIAAYLERFSSDHGRLLIGAPPARASTV